MARRFPSASDKLTQSTLYDDDLYPIRHKAGTMDDADKSVTFGMSQCSPVAVCQSTGDSTSKVATVSNYPDFKLYNGREVVIYMKYQNSATNPTLNVNGTGAIALDSTYWNAGTFIKAKYIDITVSGTRIQKWLVDAGTYNETNQLNSALANYGINVNKTLITFSDSTKYKINNADNSWYRVVHNVCYFNISIYCSTTDKSSVDVATLTNAKPTNLQYFIACKTNGTEHLQVNINTDGVINIANGQVTGVYNLSGCYLVA